MSIRVEKTEKLQPYHLQKLQWGAVNLTYQGRPTNVIVKVDGATVLSVASMPDYGGLASRTLYLPYTAFGYKPTLQWDSGVGKIEKFDWIPISAEAFQERRLWQGIRVTWEGTVNVSSTVDGNNISLAPTATLTTTEPQETRELYFPFGSWGYKINIGSDYTTNGRIIEWEPIQHVDQVYDSMRIVTQCQITYIGGVTVQMGRDGVQHGSDKTFAPNADPTRHITRQFWVKAGCRANFFQYRQSAGGGKIISFKTNEQRTDQEQPMIEKPEQMGR